MCWRISSKFRPATWKYYKGLQATSKGHAPLLIQVAAMGKCKQANNFQSHAYGHPTSLTTREAESARFTIQGYPTLR